MLWLQRVLYRWRTSVNLGASAAPDGEEKWENMRPLLAYAPEDGEWQAMVAMQDRVWN